MHRCLQIQEVLIVIFEYALLTPKSRSGDTATLAYVARTCKTFSSPALDILWSRQKSLRNLLARFPKKILKFIHTFSGRRLSFKKLPLFGDYERVKFYSGRIREITCNTTYTADIDPLVFSALLAQQPIVGALFPKLRSVTFDIEDFQNQAIYPRLLMGPSLQSISIDWENIPEEVDDIIKNIAVVLVDYLPYLREFQMDEMIFLHDASWLCQSLRHMETLKIGNVIVKPEDLNHLGSLTALVHLEFAISSQDLLLFVRGSAASTEAFRTLTTLKIHTDESKGCARLFSFLSLPHLSELVIVPWEDGRDWALDALFESITMPRLESLSILDDPLEESPPIPFTRAMLDSIFRNERLVHLDITSGLSIQLTDDDLDALSRSCPRLKHLSLPDNQLQTPASLTFNGLLALTQNCKELQTLRLRIDPNPIPQFFATGNLQPSYNLTHIGFCTSPLKEDMVHDVLQIIVFFFPGLKELDVSRVFSESGNLLPALPIEESGHQAAWMKVIDLLKPFRQLDN